MTPDFSQVTELAGSEITVEQLDRMAHRYHWAMIQCRDKDVAEVACGSGQGLGLLSNVARSFEAGDYSAQILKFPRAHYGNRVRLQELDAQALPFQDASKDVVVLFEAIYYLPQAERFVAECARVLRPKGRVLVVTANKDLWDFHPSPFSYRYFGVLELKELFAKHDFECEFFGFQPVDRVPLRQKILRPVKRMAVMSGLIPKTMNSKRWLKRIVFGAQIPMPAELTENLRAFMPPPSIDSASPDRRHKIIYCAARRRS